MRRGDFVLASGTQSNFYIDARLTSMSPEGLALIGPLALDSCRQAAWEMDAVGGLTMGADPISYAIGYASYSRPPAVRTFTIRKEAKIHGTRKLIEGPFQSGDRVVIVEDVITTGGSACRAVEAVREAGGMISGVLAIVDREEGGRERIETMGLPVITLTGVTEILALLP